MIHGMAANLRSCLECGAPLSPDAVRCPRCNADHPHGLLCCICREAVKASTAVALLNRSTNFGILKYSERGRDGKEAYMGNPGGSCGWYHNDRFRKALGPPLPQTVECGHCHNNVPYAITCEYGCDGHAYMYSRAHISACPTCGNRTRFPAASPRGRAYPPSAPPGARYARPCRRCAAGSAPPRGAAPG
jgi:ribosomal protein L40E